MDFNDVLMTARDSVGQSLTIPEKWGQGRATFGGLVAALMLQRIEVELGACRT